MTLATERNVTDNWKRNGSEHGLQIMAGDSPKTNCSRDARKLEIRIRDEFIKLGQALKLADLVSDGVEAKYVINDGLVKVNGEVDTRRGRKVYGGDVISYNGQDVKVLSGNE